MATEAPVNGVQTTLASPYITSTGQTSFNITSATGFTNAQYHVLVTDGTNYEIMLVSSQVSSVLTVTRAVESYGGVQTAYTFGSGATVTVVPSVASAIALMQSVNPPVFNIADPRYATGGQVGAGSTTADTTAYQNAVAAAITNGSGVIQFPGGTFQISNFNNQTFNGTSANLMPYAVRGMGKGITIIKSYATSLATSLTVTNTNFNSGITTSQAPWWGAFTLDGANATSTAVGISWSDCPYVTFFDMAINNFSLSGGIGMYAYNQVGWTEGVCFAGACEMQNNQICIDFAIASTAFASFDYWNFGGLYFNINANQYAIVDEIPLNTVTPAATVQHIGCNVDFKGNAINGATNTGAVFYCKGNSQWQNNHYNIHFEVDGAGAVNHKSFNLANSLAYFGGFGIINMIYGFVAPTFAGGTYQLRASGNINIGSGFGFPNAGFTVQDGSNVNGSPYAALATISLNPPTPPTITSGTAWVNNLNADVTLYIPINLTATATLKFVQQNYTISAAGATLVTATTGENFVFTVKVHANEQIRLDVSAGSIGTTQCAWG